MPFRIRVGQDDGENNIVYNTKDVDELLSRDLNRLSLQERETVFEQIHGVDQVVDESEELVQRSLEELSRELDSIQSKPAYDMAISADHASKEYVTSRKFRLLFLRCENFIAKKAATRLVLFMERVLEYFGPNALGRPLLYKDLGQEAQHYLKTGVLQLVHGARDTAGRAIFLHHYLQDEKIPKSARAMVQALALILWSAVENDVLTQRRGILCLAYIIGPMSCDLNAEAIGEAVRVRDWLPIKFPVQHVCFNDPVMHVWAPLVYGIIPRDLRQRFKLHDGTHIECMYELQSFGIPVGKLPLDYFGNIVHKEHDDWIERRKLQDLEVSKGDLSAVRHNDPYDKDDNNTNTDNNSGSIKTPAKADVALWRGRVYQLHPGNIRMRQLIDDFQDEYDSAPRRTGIKADIVMRIVSIIKDNDGGRFLTKDPDNGTTWIVVSDDEAKKRVSKAFRSARQSTTTSTTTVTIKNGPKRLRLETASPPTTGVLSVAIPATMDSDGICGGGCPRKFAAASPQNALFGTRSLF